MQCNGYNKCNLFYYAGSTKLDEKDYQPGERVKISLTIIF